MRRAETKRLAREARQRPDPRDRTPPFDWDRLAEHVATIRADLAAEIAWTMTEPNASQDLWGIVHDPFGKTVHGRDSALRIGSIVEIGEATMDWHGSAIVPVYARVLRKSSHAEAERLAHKRLVRRAHYYEVCLD